MSRRLRGAIRSAVLAAVSAGLVLPAGLPALAAGRVVPHIDGFGPYKLGMTLDQAKAADTGGKPGSCGEFAEDRQCLFVKAEVFQEPAIIYAVLDPTGARVDRVVAKLDPSLTQRRAYRCVRLSEKVFALLVVVYGSRYKQSYDQNRRPLPAVAWDGEESGRLIFEAKCRTHDEGNPLISVVERYPDGVKPPPVAAKPGKAPAAAVAASGLSDPSSTVDATAPVANVPLTVENRGIEPSTSAPKSPDIALAPRSDLPPPPVSAPIGIVEESALGAPDTSGAIEAGDRMALLTRELAHAKGKAQPTAAEPPVAPAAATVQETVPTLPAPQGATASDAASPAPSGDGYTIPLDIAPPSSDVAQAGQPAIAIGDTQAPAPVEAKVEARKPAAPVQRVAQVVDPGPVSTANPVSPVAAAPPPQPAKIDPAPRRDVPAGRPVVSDAAAARQAVAQSRPAQSAVSASEAAKTAAAVAAAPLQTARRPALDDVPAPAENSRAAAVAENPPAPQPYRTASLPPVVRPPSYREAYEPPEPTDLEAPEPLAMPEEEKTFRRQRDGGEGGNTSATAQTEIEVAVRQRLATAAPAPATSAPARATPPSAPAPQPVAQPGAQPDAETRDASAAPVSLLSVARAGGEPARQGSVEWQQTREIPSIPVPARPAVQSPEVSADPAPAADSGVEAPPVASPFASGWGNAKAGGFSPVTSGGWRRKAPVPPARPWRERTDITPVSGTDA